MTSKIIVLIFLSFLLFSFNVESSRPVYSFSDDVFSELPEYPSDFDEITSLYRSQKIKASQLSIDYLQPEILPSWSYYAERVYGKNAQNMGSYGIFFYPSSMAFSNVSKGDCFSVSSLVYCQWGIQFYQGLKLGFEHDSDLSINISQPNILLSPTYPKFKPGWMQKIMFNITVNKTGSYVINLSEQKPDEQYNSLWSTTYPGSYISGYGFTAMKTPRFQVYLYPPVIETTKIDTGDIGFLSAWVFPLFIIFIISILIIIRWCYSKKREAKME